MANYIYLELDTTAPSNPSVIIGTGSQYISELYSDLTISTSDVDTLGYQMKIWGDVDLANDGNVQDTELNSSWITYNTTYQVKFSPTNESKAIFLKIRDDVHNESSTASDSVILDTTLPIVTVSSPDRSVISKVSGKNLASFSFTSDSQFEEYKVKVVGDTGATHDTGYLIAETNGSSNTSGTAGGYPAATAISVTISGTDLENASAGDGEKIIKVFVREASGNWNV